MFLGQLDMGESVTVSFSKLQLGTATPGHQGQNLEIRVLLRPAIDCVASVRMCTLWQCLGSCVSLTTWFLGS